MTWRAIQTKPAAEKRVVEALTEIGIEAYRPIEAVWRRRNGRKARYERSLIAGYAFALMTDDQQHLIHGIDGAQRFVSFNGKAATIPAVFIEQIRAAEAAGEFDHAQTPARRVYTKGQRVRVTEGPYAGYVGAITKLKGERRVQMLLEMTRGVSWAVTEAVERVEPVAQAEQSRQAA